MSADRWAETDRVLQAALARPAGEREAFVRATCGADADLVREVLSLLAHADSAEGYLKSGLGSRRAPSAAPVRSGARIGPYLVGELIGVGGMGEVFRARDTKLERDVAIKFLPESVAGDLDRLARFEREARALAALNHPNIAAVYAVEDRAMVMEFVAGVDLSERIAHGALRLPEALAIGKQIALALEAAHEGNIVHRDLKPANVRVRDDGAVKVLDFGLAKARDEDAARLLGSDPNPQLANSPTLTSHGTRAGMLLGTAAYMAPEQARGKPVDKRADIWAFGAVLYEMLTGRVAFAGETVTDILSAVIEKEPDWGALPAGTPPLVERLVRRCLTKDIKQRLHDIGDARLELEEALTPGFGSAPQPSRTPEMSATSVGARSGRSSRLPWVVASLFLVAAVAAAYVFWRPATAAPVQYASILPPDNTVFETIAFNTAGGPVLSADGSKLAFIARDSQGKTMLYVQRLNAPKAELMPGTEGANYPFWSPDSRSIGYFKESQVWKIEAAGGPPEIVCQTCSSQLASYQQKGGAWNDAGTILFGFGSGPGAPPLSRVAAGGGVGEPVFAFEPGDNAHRWPQFLPDGRHFLFFVSSDNPDTAGMYAASLDSPGRTLVVRTNVQAQYVAPGYLLFMRDDTLMAQPFDPGRRTTSGTAAPIADHVATVQQAARAVFSASGTGALVYQAAAAGTGLLQLTWFDRQGKATGTLGTLESYLDPAISPDGRRVAVSIGPKGRNDIWVFDLAQGTKTRLTLGPGGSRRPVWTPDGANIVFTANRTGQAEHIYQKPADNSGPEEEVPGGGASDSAWSLSRDGRYIAIVRPRADRQSSLWVLPRFGDRTPVPINPTEFMGTPAISPDGKWLAYGSTAPGAKLTDIQVFVTPFPGGGARWQVSTGGGALPQWRDDGRELYFETMDQLSVMAVEVSVRGAAPQFGTPYPVFGATMLSAINGGYATVDGKKFLANVINAQNDSRNPLTLVTNWTGLLKK